MPLIIQGVVVRAVQDKISLNNDDESYKKLIEIDFAHSRSPLIPVLLDCVPFTMKKYFS